MRKNQRGTIIVLLAILLPAVLIILGLAIDLGMAYSARTAAQSAADAAAIAGAASYLKDSPPDPINDAVAVANGNTILRNAISITSSNVTLPTTGGCAGANCVTVTIPFTSDTYFARLFGWRTISMTVNATAQAGSGSSAAGSYCTKPIFMASGGTSIDESKHGCGLSNPAVNASTAPGTFLPDIRPLDTTCTLPGSPQLYYSVDFGTYVTTGPVYFTDGTSDPDSGGNVYRDSWTKCTAVRVTCGEFPVEAGGMIGPTGQGVTDAEYTDTWNGVGDYGTNHSDTSDSLVTAPVWDTGSGGVPVPCLNPEFHGAKCVKIIGFAEIFVNPYNDKQGKTPISAEFVRYVGCGGAGGGSETGSGPSGALIRLVKTPS